MDFRNRTPTYGTTGTFGAKPIREHRERKEKLEVAAQEARALLSDDRFSPAGCERRWVSSDKFGAVSVAGKVGYAERYQSALPIGHQLWLH